MVDSPYGYYDRGLDDDKEEPLAFEEQFILRVNDEILKGDPEAGVKGLREAVMSRKPLEGVSFKFKGE
jgi:transcription initiation factor TFIID subunit 7